MVVCFPAVGQSEGKNGFRRRSQIREKNAGHEWRQHSEKRRVLNGKGILERIENGLGIVWKVLGNRLGNAWQRLGSFANILGRLGNVWKSFGRKERTTKYTKHTKAGQGRGQSADGARMQSWVLGIWGFGDLGILNIEPCTLNISVFIFSLHSPPSTLHFRPPLYTILNSCQRMEGFSRTFVI